MGDDWVIKVENVSKKFCKSLKRSMVYGFTDSLKNMVGLDTHEERLRKGEFLSLQNIDFELKKGESLGLIGRNGCGKSTLLRIINGIYPPSSGKVTIKGRMGALIAVGAGFHPHMSGRENICLNATILGMSQKEVNSRMDEIIEFAEIGDFIDAPVATYSSGMTVRLGFAIAVHADIDILLADEVLAVGDAIFKRKCVEKILELRKRGVSIVFVSHDAAMVERVCRTSVFIKDGQIVSQGDTANVISDYLRSLVDQQKSVIDVVFKKDTSQDVALLSARIKNHSSDGQGSIFDYQDKLSIIIGYEVLVETAALSVAFAINKKIDGEKVRIMQSFDTNVQQTEHIYENIRKKGLYKKEVFFQEDAFLTRGEYSVDVLSFYSGLDYCQVFHDALKFEIVTVHEINSANSKGWDNAAVNKELTWVDKG